MPHSLEVDQTRQRIFYDYILYTGDQRDEAIVLQDDQAQDKLRQWDSRKFFLGNVSIAEFYTISPEKYALVINSIGFNCTNRYNSTWY